MADRELRKMNRTELIEIIYALQQNDKVIQQENEDLRRQLEDRKIRMSQAGSIAEAALSLNHIFEDAEEAAKQYLDSIRDTQQQSGHSVEEEQKASCLGGGSLSEKTGSECDRQLEEVRKERVRQLEEARQECDRLREEARQECNSLREQTRKEACNKINTLNREIRVLLDKYPVLREYLKREFEMETGGNRV